jgi:long-chain acyl-CoA synthetase
MDLARCFERTVKLHPGRAAVVEGTGEPMSYANLGRRVASMAGWLRGPLELAAGSRVALVMPNCSEYLEVMLAVWHAGLCVVPVNSKLHPNEFDYVLRHCGASACFSRGELRQSLAPICEQIGVRLIDVDSIDYRTACTTPPIEPQSRGDELAWIFYTSGTTGRPKGVMLTHDNLIAMALNFLADLQCVEATGALAHVAPLSHGSGLYSIPYWMQGGLQVIPRSGGFDEAELFELLNHHASVSVFAAPTIVRRMVRYKRLTGRETANLRTLLVGGAPFYAEDIRDAVDCFGPCVAQLYGQGESPMSITALRAHMIGRAVLDEDTAMIESVGTRLTAVEVEIHDSSGEVPLGTPGEVVVRGPTVMRGYWADPAATAEALRGGWLHTGDVGLMDERGLLHLKDRSKDVIISGGSNIYPREVEEVLLLHPAVREVSVVGRRDAEWGEIVVAFVAADGISEAELDAWCLQHVARFKRPKVYRFVQALPRNNYGKVIKTELRKMLGSAAR